MEDFFTKLGAGVSYMTWPRMVFLVGFILTFWKGLQLFKGDFDVRETDNEEIAAVKRKDARRAKLLFIFGLALLVIAAWKIWMFGFNGGAATT
jgi:hypothetical protein